MGRLRLIPVIAVMAPLAALALPGPARACTPIGQTAHMVIGSMQATDQTPPTLPAIPPPTIHRADGSGQAGCGAPKCRDVGIILIAVAATDDTTAPEKIGYRFTVESGTLPATFALPGLPLDPNAGTAVELYWSADTGDESIDVTLRVVAIDLAGNESAPQTVRIADDGGQQGGCAVARSHHSGTGLAGLAAAAVLLAARRRRRQRAN